MRLPSIRRILTEAKRAACRFPLVLLCAFAAVFSALARIEADNFRESSAAYPVLLAAALGVPLMAALALTAEKRKWGKGLAAAGQSAGVLLLAAYALTVPTSLPGGPAAPLIRFALLAIGLVLLVMIAPYLGKGETNGFWQYNRVLYFRLFVTGVFSVVLFVGLAIALAALENLFGVAVPEKRYPELWVIVAGAFAPWFFFAGIPEDLDGLDRAEDYPRGLKVFAQYILFSLVLVYLVILYGYLLKILLQWSWPKGLVSSLILGFSATAILSLLLMHPVRDREGNAWIRAAGRWLYIALIPLVAVLFLAVTERIGDYGITESRYAGIALGTWLSAQVLYFLFSRTRSIKFTVGSLCLLALLISFGPWGMLRTSERSQADRLTKLLVRGGILADGRISAGHRPVSQDDAQEISSIVNYLGNIHGYRSIQPWFADALRPEMKEEANEILSASEVLKRMGVPFVADRDESGSSTFSIDPLQPIDVAGFDRILRQQLLVPNAAEQTGRRFDAEGISYEVDQNAEMLTVQIGDARAGFDTVQVDIGSWAERLMLDAQKSAVGTGKMSPASMTIHAGQNGHRVMVVFSRLILARREGRTAIASGSFDLAFTERRSEK